MFKSGCNYKVNLVLFGQQCVQQLRLGFENPSNLVFYWSNSVNTRLKILSVKNGEQ